MRNRIYALGMAACLIGGYRAGDAVVSVNPPAEESKILVTTLCTVMRNPAAFSNRIVKLRATPEFAFEHSSMVDPADRSCEGPWLDIAPDGEDKMRGFTSDDEHRQAEHPVQLIKDVNYKRFTDALGAKVYSLSEEVHTFWNIGGHPRYRVTATMTGRLEFAEGSTHGFGQMGQWRVRFILISVEDVTTEELPYDWTRFSRAPGPFPHGTIHGRVIDANGEPMGRALVEAIRTQGTLTGDEPGASTDADGTYSIELQPGSYYVVVNRKQAASEKEPLLVTYHPSTEQRARAAVVTVSDGAELNRIDIQATHILKPRTLDIQVLDAGGRPLPGIAPFLTEVGRDGPISFDSSENSTNVEGHIRLTAFEGVDYVLWVDNYGGPPEARCAPTLQLDHNRFVSEPIVVKTTLGKDACERQAAEVIQARIRIESR